MITVGFVILVVGILSLIVGAAWALASGADSWYNPDVAKAALFVQGGAAAAVVGAVIVVAAAIVGAF